jgi:hypothetical protein
VIFLIAGSIACQIFVYISMHSVTLPERKLIHDGIVMSAIIWELLIFDTILLPIYIGMVSILCEGTVQKMPELLI